MEKHSTSPKPVVSADSESSDEEASESSFTMIGAGAKTIKFWERGIVIVTIGFNYGFFFVAMTGMYLLLRKDSDFSELDEIHVDPPKDVLPLPQIQSAEPELPKPLVDPPSDQDEDGESGEGEDNETPPADSDEDAQNKDSSPPPVDQEQESDQADDDQDDDGELRVEDE